MTALLPLVGAILLATLPKSAELRAKQLAFGSTLVTAASAIAMAVQFQRDNTDLQFVEVRSWIPSFGINYAVGVDDLHSYLS